MIRLPEGWASGPPKVEVAVPETDSWLMVEEAWEMKPPAKVEMPLEIVVVAEPLVLTVISPPLTVSLLEGPVVPMPTLPLFNILIACVAAPVCVEE